MTALAEPGPGATLPSSVTAYRLVVERDPVAIPLMVRDVLFRGLLVGAGIRVAGEPWKRSLLYGLAGSCAIELFVLGYTAFKHREAL